MQPVAAGLDRTTTRALAEYYGALPVPRSSAALDETLIARGLAIARNGIPTRFVPACGSCHGPSQLPPNPRFPVLNGQPADFLTLQLQLFQAGKRGGSNYAHLMQLVAAGLRPEEMLAVAVYYQSLEPQQ
jgi:cytochrome c553